MKAIYHSDVHSNINDNIMYFQYCSNGGFKCKQCKIYLHNVFPTLSLRKILMLTMKHILGQKQIPSIISLGRYTEQQICVVIKL